MCLSFVRRNLSSNKYNWVQEFIDDVQLIWSNCKTYNQDNSEIWKMADHLEKVTRKTIEKFYKIPKSMGKSKFCFKLGKNFYPTDGLDDNDFLPPEINLNEE